MRTEAIRCLSILFFLNVMACKTNTAPETAALSDESSSLKGKATVLGSTWDDELLGAIVDGERLWLTAQYKGYSRQLWLGGWTFQGDLTQYFLKAAERSWDIEVLADSTQSGKRVAALIRATKQPKRDEPPVPEQTILVVLSPQDGRIINQFALNLPQNAKNFHLALRNLKDELVLAWQSDDYHLQLKSFGFDGQTRIDRELQSDIPFVVEEIRELADQAFAVAGRINYDTTTDAFAGVLTSSLRLVWSQSYGGDKFDGFLNLQETNDKGMLLVGESDSFDGTTGFLVEVDRDGLPILTQSFQSSLPIRLVDIKGKRSRQILSFALGDRQDSSPGWIRGSLNSDQWEAFQLDLKGGEKPLGSMQLDDKELLIMSSSSVGHGGDDILLVEQLPQSTSPLVNIKEVTIQARRESVDTRSINMRTADTPEIMSSPTSFLELAEANLMQDPLKDSLIRFVSGNRNDVSTNTEYGLVIMGGSTDVDNAMRAMITSSGGGDFLVLRSSGTPAYNDYIFSELGGVDSVETLIIDSREKANDPRINEIVRQAEALFIAGGDQWNYVKQWQGTNIVDSINWLAREKKIPMGGTSSGCNVLGSFYFTAEFDAVNSEEALSDPYGRKMTLARNDLFSFPYMQNTFAEPHFNKPDRMGRGISFLARALCDNWLTQPGDARMVAVDQRTAVVVDADGKARVFSYGDEGNQKGYAYFIQAKRFPDSCEAGRPLSFDSDGAYPIHVQRIPGDTQGSGRFDFNTWTSPGATVFHIGVMEGRLSEDIVPDFDEL